ncbi:hypothetical protein RGV33_29850 [Pseudomonas sp. Bout1]|uniref:hypothetical protein n=1 Tax=Pseudomonas sp. Bout1 TaxID=3048600 RepID=UPI002AB51723|nr:hypothetical protein [Pseudomonas sp. Bout1]MDY7535826.1 hypothetical protein [Pseudomonas sp. Bout1]MEB0188691.1 hypothetical protein [Pseudomonas sp. Bout1]
MSTEKFDIDEKELHKAKTLSRGVASIEVSRNGTVSHVFVPTDVFGYLSWSALDGAVESVRISYGSDLKAGPHESKAPFINVTYRDADGHSYHQPVLGDLTVLVDRPEFGTTFKHVGKLKDVKFESDEGTVTLNGNYTVESD